MRVSILDDHPVLLQSLARVLTDAGVEVSAACTEPEQFLARVRRDRPGSVLIDLELGGPGRDGLAVLRRLRQRPAGPAAVVLAAAYEPARVADCFREGAAAYLLKGTASVPCIVAALAAAERGERVLPPCLPAAPGPGRLTPRERQVLALLGEGHDDLAIGARLEIGERTVRAHLSALCRKLRAESRGHLSLAALHLGPAARP